MKSITQGLIAVAGLLTLTCGAQTVPHAVTTPPLPQTEQRLKADVTLRDIVTVPDKVMGRKVTIEGVVSQVYSNRTFTMRGKNAMQNSRVPILVSKPIPGQYGRSDADPIHVGDPVQVTGVVTRFAIEEMQKTTGKRYVERDYRVYLSKPALIASFVVVQPGSGGSSEGMSIKPDRRAIFATARELLATSDLNSLIGKPVRINAAKVLSVISDRGFYVGVSAERRMFAVLDHSLDDGKMESLVVVKKGQTLWLEGTVEKMPTEQNALKRWTVDPKEAAQLAKQAAYLHVRSIRFK